MTKDELERALTKSEAARQEQFHEMAALKEELRKQIHEKDDLSVKLQAATAPIRRDTYAAAVSTYGKHSQLIMAMEEMAELTKELSKNIRGGKNITAISEEIADVEIMLEQLKIIFRNRAEVDRLRSEKLNRLIGRLTDEMA